MPYHQEQNIPQVFSTSPFLPSTAFTPIQSSMPPYQIPTGIAVASSTNLPYYPSNMPSIPSAVRLPPIQQVMPQQVMSQQVMSQQVMSQQVMSQQMMPQQVMSQQVMPQQVMPPQAYIPWTPMMGPMTYYQPLMPMAAIPSMPPQSMAQMMPTIHQMQSAPMLNGMPSHPLMAPTPMTSPWKKPYSPEMTDFIT